MQSVKYQESKGSLSRGPKGPTQPYRRLPAIDERHLQAEWFAGTWQGFDPTNNIEIGDRHVLVGRGRDYNDVPPLRGVYGGHFKGQLNVKVTITREA